MRIKRSSQSGGLQDISYERRGTLNHMKDIEEIYIEKEEDIKIFNEMENKLDSIKKITVGSMNIDGPQLNIHDLKVDKVSDALLSRVADIQRLELRATSVNDINLVLYTINDDEDINGPQVKKLVNIKDQLKIQKKINLKEDDEISKEGSVISNHDKNISFESDEESETSVKVKPVRYNLNYTKALESKHDEYDDEWESYVDSSDSESSDDESKQDKKGDDFVKINKVINDTKKLHEKVNNSKSNVETPLSSVSSFTSKSVTPIPSSTKSKNDNIDLKSQSSAPTSPRVPKDARNSNIFSDKKPQVQAQNLKNELSIARSSAKNITFQAKTPAVKSDIGIQEAVEKAVDVWNNSATVTLEVKKSEEVNPQEVTVLCNNDPVMTVTSDTAKISKKWSEDNKNNLMEQANLILNSLRIPEGCNPDAPNDFPKDIEMSPEDAQTELGKKVREIFDLRKKTPVKTSEEEPEIMGKSVYK